MSHEGVTLVMRVLLVAVLILITAIFRTVIGPGKRRGRIAMAGTLAGISFGLLLAHPVSQWVGTDLSVICACVGIVLGWAVSWVFARRIPREAD
jgi:drug/metabolite transporter (DMT)-like permease